MLKRLFVAVLLLSAFYVFLSPDYSVNAQNPALSMTVSCPTKAYVGESFFCQVTIHNDDNVSHRYQLLWSIDSPLNKNTTFENSGTIEPNETINTGSSFTFSKAQDQVVSYISPDIHNPHLISITLTQDGQLVTTEDHYIETINVEVSLITSVTPAPIFANSSFSLDLAVINDGDEEVNATLVVYEVRDKIQLQSAVTANLGTVYPKLMKNQTFNFDVIIALPPSTYAIKVMAKYIDTRGKQYSRNYYVPISISSREVVDELGLLESKEENDFNKLRSDLDTTYRSITMINAAILVVSVGLALANYWYTRRMTHTRRKITTEKPRTS